jgi:hypothetical protein
MKLLFRFHDDLGDCSCIDEEKKGTRLNPNELNDR